MPARPPAVHRLCFIVDIEAYGQRVHTAQLDAQDRLLWTMTQACRLAGVELARCERQDRGDGQLLVLPPGIDQGRTVPALVSGVRDALREVNRVRGEAGRIRLRSALSQGVVQTAPTGFVGRSVVLGCYLLDSAAAHAALAGAPDSDLMVIVSDDLYHDVFSQGFAGRGAPEFRRVQISRPEKNFTAIGWIQVPGPGLVDPRIPEYRKTPGDLRTPEERRQAAIFAALALVGGSGTAAYDIAAFAANLGDAVLDDEQQDDRDSHHSFGSESGYGDDIDHETDAGFDVEDDDHDHDLHDDHDHDSRDDHH